MKDQTEVSPLSGEGDPLSVPLQHSFCLLRLPLPAFLSASLADCFPSLGGIQAYHVPLVCPDGLGPTCSPVMSDVSERGNWIPLYPSHTFWFKPVSTFGLALLTTLLAVHLCWPYHPTLAPDRIGARSRSIPSRVCYHPEG